MLGIALIKFGSGYWLYKQMELFQSCTIEQLWLYDNNQQEAYE